MKKKLKGGTPTVSNLLNMTNKKRVSAGQKTAMRNVSKPESEATDLWTLKTAAEKLDLSERSARNLLASVPVAGKDGQARLYDSKLVLDAALRMAGKRRENNDTREELEREKLRLQIRKLVIEAETAEGKVMSMDEVYSTCTALHMQVRKQLFDMVDKLPPVLAGLTPAAMQTRLRDHIENMLEILREHKWDKA